MGVTAMISSLIDFLALIAAYLLCIFIHELGHTLAALLVGWKPLTLEIGVGTQRTILRIGDLRLKFGTLLHLGLARALALDFKRFRARDAIVTLGGPVATAAGLWIAILLGGTAREGGRWSLFLLGMCVFQGWFLLVSLIPRTFRLQGNLVPNDGLALWQTLRLTPDQLRRQYWKHRVGLARFFTEEKRFLEALPLATEAFESAESTAERAYLAPFRINLLLEVGKLAEARDEITKVLRSEAYGPDRLHLLDTLASFPVFYSLPDLLPVAHEAIDEALRLASESITLKGTKGALLIESGDLPAGTALLEEVCQTTQSENDRAIGNYYLAYASFKSGKMEEAHRQLEATAAKYPDHPLRKKISPAILEERPLEREGGLPSVKS